MTLPLGVDLMPWVRVTVTDGGTPPVPVIPVSAVATIRSEVREGRVVLLEVSPVIDPVTGAMDVNIEAQDTMDLLPTSPPHAVWDLSYVDDNGYHTLGTEPSIPVALVQVASQVVTP